MIFLEVGTF